MYNVHEMPETAAQAIQLPDNEGVALPEGLQACGEARSVVFLARRSIAIEVPLTDANGEYRVPLKVQYLRAIGL
jgi:hypothetical protein